MRLLSNPVAAIQRVFEEAFSMDTVETVFHTGLGFGGTAMGSRLLIKEVIPALGASPFGRVGATLGVGILNGALMGMVGGARLGARALTGGMLATLWQILSEALPAGAKEFIPTLGQGPETEEFRRAIETEVLRELRGSSGNNSGMSVYLQPAGVQETYLQPAGSAAYLTAREARQGGLSAYMTQAEARGAGMGEISDEFATFALPERF